MTALKPGAQVLRYYSYMGLRLTKTLPSLRRAAASVLACLVVACGGGDSTGLPPVIGKRVLYTTDTDGSGPVDELYAAETGSLTQTVLRIDSGLSAGDAIGGPFGFGSAGKLGYWVRTNQAGTMFDLHLLPRAGGPTTVPLQGINLDKFQVGSNGQRFAFSTYSSAGSPRTLSVADADATTIVPLSTAFQDFEFSGDGRVVYWIEYDGTWRIRSSDVSGTLTQITSQVVATYGTDPNWHPWVWPTRDGLSVIALPPNSWGEPLYIASQDGSSYTPLITPPPIDSGVTDVLISPDGAFALYQVITGDFFPVMHLWFVPLAAPLTEQRVDPVSVDYLGQPETAGDFAISPDGARFAWKGSAGGGNQIFVASAANPTASTALTPAIATVQVSNLRWIDATTLAYVSFDQTQGAALRTVSVNAPLTTVALGPDESAGGGIGGWSEPFTTCSDGTVVFFWNWDNGPAYEARLYRATALDADSAVQIAPTLVDDGDLFLYRQVACVD